MGNQQPDEDTRKLTYQTRTTATFSRMRGRWVYLGYTVWASATFLMLIPTVLGIGPRYQQLITQAAGGVPIGAATLSAETYATLITTLAGLYVLSFLALGLLIFWQRSSDWMAILASLLLISIGTSGSDFSEALLINRPDLILLVDWIRSMGLGFPVVVLFLFPSGKAQPPWTRYLAFGHLIWVMARPLLLNVEPLHPNYWSGGFFFLWFAVWLGLALYSQVYRYQRVASANQRQQTKWLIYGTFIGALGFILIQLARAIAAPAINVDAPSWFVFEYPIYVLIGLPIPISVAISVLRFRLWDIDFIINRSLVYGALTALLVAIFGGSLIAINNVASAMGSSQQAIIAVAVAAMVFGMILLPARRALQRFVDRQFYNIQIDYEKVGRKDKPIQAVSASEMLSNKIELSAYGELVPIGSGGMAEIYRGTHPTTQEPVAVKLMQESLVEKGDYRVRFDREAEIMANLDHRNIVAIFDYGETAGVPFMVMEFIEGDTFGDMLEERKRMAVQDALLPLRELADALDYTHQNGMVHRDVKASNVMTEYGPNSRRAILMDFGIARIMGEGSELTSTGVVGTFYYMAPEQIQQAGSVDHRADIYSLGVLTYQMVTGEMPFNHPNPGGVLIAHLQQPPPDPRKVVSTIPRGAAHAIMRAMAKNPEERFATAGAFVDAIEEAIGLRVA